MFVIVWTGGLTSRVEMNWNVSNKTRTFISANVNKLDMCAAYVGRFTRDDMLRYASFDDLLQFYSFNTEQHQQLSSSTVYIIIRVADNFVVIDFSNNVYMYIDIFQ